MNAATQDTNVEGTRHRIVVLGAGAAGLFAATAAAEHGCDVLLIEQNRKPSVKILASGGTKCDVTSTLGIDKLGQKFGKKAERFLRFGLHEIPPKRVSALLHEFGVPTAEFSFEKVFSVSGKAADVLDGFLRRAMAAGVRIETGVDVKAIAR
jgi:predicted flavoprotein YhiN